MNFAPEVRLEDIMAAVINLSAAADQNELILASRELTRHEAQRQVTGQYAVTHAEGIELKLKATNEQIEHLGAAAMDLPVYQKMEKLIKEFHRSGALYRQEMTETLQRELQNMNTRVEAWQIAAGGQAAPALQRQIEEVKARCIKERRATDVLVSYLEVLAALNAEAEAVMVEAQLTVPAAGAHRVIDFHVHLGPQQPSAN